MHELLRDQAFREESGEYKQFMIQSNYYLQEKIQLLTKRLVESFSGLILES